eukprot:391511_1
MIGFIYVTHGYFIMNNLNVSDIRMWWTHFIFGEGIKDGTISNSSFHTTQFKPEYAQTYSLIYMQHVHLNTFDKLIINNSSFENIISGGVLNIGIGTHGNIIFANNIITTSHLWSQALAYNDIALIMVTETAKLTMDNISLTYVWMDKIDEVCNIWKRDVPITGQNYIDVYCQVPYRFIRSAGLIVMNDIYITNDLNQNGLYDFRDRYLLSTNITSIENISSIGIHFEPDIYSYANAIIYNDRGQLVMDSILIYGVALHVSVLYNTGIAFVSDLNLSHPNYYYNNSDKINVKTLIEVIYNVGVHSGLTDEQCKNNNECYSDHINLELTNGVIIIDNSNINGGVIGIYDHSGYIELYETVISNVLISIYAWNSVSVKIKFCDFNNIGHYHKADFISLCWVYNMGRWMDHSMFFWNVKNISIAHNIFNYFPLTDYIFFWNGDRLRETNAIITDNDFMNPITSNTFTTHHFEPFALIGIKYNGWISNLNESKYHLVNFKGYWNLIKFINNIFYPNDIISISNKTACLFIDDYNWIVTNESYNCISGNIFHGIAVQINSGILTSCIHPQLSFHNRNNNTYCWSEFGAFDEDINTESYNDLFIATQIGIPIIKLFDHAQMIMDNATISTNFSMSNIDSSNNINSTYNLFSMNSLNGIISFLDVIIDDINQPIDIKYDKECINYCIRLYDSNLFNMIHQLHLDCQNITQTLETISLKNAQNIEIINQTT